MDFRRCRERHLTSAQPALHLPHSRSLHSFTYRFNKFNCTSTVQKQVAIAPSPVAAFTNMPACVNQGTQFTDASSGSIKSWFWQIGSNTYSFQNPVHVFGTQGSYSAKLTVSDNNGCIAQIAKPISVPVPQSPDFSVTSACATKPAVFQDVSVLTIDPFTSYQWDFAGLGTGTGAVTQFIFPSVASYPVTMMAHATSGCVYSITKQIGIVVPPKAGFTTSADQGAVPLTVQFTNVSTTANSYLWHFNDVNNTTSNSTSPSFTFTALGDYAVDLEAKNTAGCVDTFTEIISAVVPGMDAAISNLQFVQVDPAGGWQASFLLENLGNVTLVNPAIHVEVSGVTLKSQLNITLKAHQSETQILPFSFLPKGISYVCLEVMADGDINVYNNKQCVSASGGSFIFDPYPNPSPGKLQVDWVADTDGPARISIFTTTGAKAYDKPSIAVELD